MPFFDVSLVDRLGYFIVLLLSLTVHEWAHAISAFRLGDDTASRMGRLTLNPISHIDPIGTVALPLLGVPFGWAKPVPVNPARFRSDTSMGTGMAVTAFAGPLSNLVIALLCAATMGLLLRFWPEVYMSEKGLRFLLNNGILINLTLALFNMLPFPPLDGSRIVDGFMPYRWRSKWEAVARFGPLLLLAVLVFPTFRNLLLAGPMSMASSAVRWVMLNVAGYG